MPGFWKRVAFAFRSWYSILVHARIPDDVARGLGLALPAPAGRKQTVPLKPAADSSDRAVQMLALLQRDGRLIDFLEEDVAPYPDEQLGAAVRNIHESCRQVLQKYVTLEPIVSAAEDQPFTVAEGFDAASIKLIGNVMGEPPLRGVVRHRGWRIAQINLPSLPAGSGRTVIAPAEIEVS
jgi:uncharacterized protein DUF2760